MRSFIRQHRVVVAVSVVVAIVGLAALAIGYFGVHTLFIDDEVSEAAPTFDAPPVEAATAEGPVGEIAPAPELPATEATDLAANDAGEPGDGAPEPDAPPATTAPPAAPTPEIVTELSGTFVSGAHPTSGTAVVLGNGTGQRFLRFEDFETDNGPDLNVYLVNSSTGDVSDYVDLGDLKGNIGEQNYEIARDIDLGIYDQVVIWCVRFGVGFGSADLA